MDPDDDRGRWPSWVYGAGSTPDPRFSMANERTFLAWVRTSLALLAGGVALREFVEPFDIQGGRRTLAVIAIATSAAAVVLGYRRWVGAQQAMRLGEPLPPSLGIPVVAAALAVLAVASGVLVLLA